MIHFQTILVFIMGLFLGLGIGFVILLFQKKQSGRIQEEIKNTFSSLSLQALEQNANQFLKLAHETLDQRTSLASKDLEGKKELIDKTLEGVEGQLKEVQKFIQSSDKNQATHLNLVVQQLENAKTSTEKLQNTTQRLEEVLANSKKRGEWGERMAEDVLRVVGFQEGINYLKQHSHEKDDEGLSRPDFTFLLPQELKLNMDVKFPFDNYLRYLEEEGEADKELYKQKFLKDVRARIKEVTTRDYINQDTVDYCLVFIPNEQVYSFLQSEDPGLLDEALKNRVVLSSPLTLYAILAVIRQAVDNFNLGKTNREILANLRQFRKQWESFIAALHKLGKRISDTQRDYDTLVTTRKNQLERPLNKIEGLKSHTEIDENTTSPVTPEGESEDLIDEEEASEVDTPQDELFAKK
jgi:DNA recombination protein RmuC